MQSLKDLPNGGTIIVNSFLLTNNAGGPDGDIAYLIAKGWTILTGPNFVIIGGASDFPDASALATVTSLQVADIANYKVNGADIECQISQNFILNGPMTANCTEVIETDGVLEFIGPNCFVDGIVSVTAVGCTGIGSGAFKDCVSFREFNDTALLTIGNERLSGCTNLNRINLQNATAINDSAFLNCTSLVQDVNVQQLTLIGSGAFEGSGITNFSCPLIDFNKPEC